MGRQKSPEKQAQERAQADKATILKYFLMLNTGGKAISEEHLDKVRALYKNITDKTNEED